MIRSNVIPFPSRYPRRVQPYRVRIDVSAFLIGVLAWIGFMAVAVLATFGLVKVIIG